jgi:hypothetical protein
MTAAARRVRVSLQMWRESVLSPMLAYDDLHLPSDFAFRDDVPRTRGACPTARPCPHLKCRYHLWLVEAEAMPGRRRETVAPASSFHPWSNTTCALDVAEKGERLETGAVAKMLGMSPRQVRRIVASGLAKIGKLGGARRLLAAIGEK